jgi:hypothetical protein
MIKALLLATVIAWPFTAIAQDAPAAPAVPHATAEMVAKIVGKMCLKDVSVELGKSLTTEFTLVMAFDTPFADNAFARNMVLESTKDEDGAKEVFVLSTIFMDKQVVTQCISTFGGYEIKAVETMKQKWKSDPPKLSTLNPDEKSSVAPLTTPPAAGTTTTPKFDNNPDE